MPFKEAELVCNQCQLTVPLVEASGTQWIRVSPVGSCTSEQVRFYCGETCELLALTTTPIPVTFELPPDDEE